MKRYESQLSRVSRTNGIRNGWIQLILETGPRYFVTLHFNRSTALSKVQKATNVFFCKVNRKLLGREWYKSTHLTLIGFPEHLETNQHVHCLLALPESLDHHLPIGNAPSRRLVDIINGAWRSIISSGTTDVRSIDNSPEVLASYVTKESWQDAFDMRVIVLK
jgi:hypothetical protein